MKWLFLIVCICLLSIFSCKQEKLVPSQISTAIASLKIKYAPDKRTSIFNITPYLSTKSLVLKGETQYPEAKTALIAEIGSIPYIDSIEILPSKNLGNELFGVINIPVANIRSNPSHSAELSTQALCGTALRLWNFKNGWVYCQTPDEYLGWLDLDAIMPMDSIKWNQWKQSKKVIVTSDQSYVWNSKQSNSIITALSNGAILKSGNVADKNWTEVEMPDGRKGILTTNNVMSLEEWKKQKSIIPSSHSIIASAQSLLGRPYLWGGTSVNGMDCSGFTKMVFYQNGLQLPRDASQQVHVGKPISTDTTFSNLETGDFLFFGRKMTDSLPEKITHVAIYMGDKKIIHASGYIKIESLHRGDIDFAESRIRSFVRATRPLKSPQEHGIPSIAQVNWY